jgi:hypothetical protein
MNALVSFAIFLRRSEFCAYRRIAQRASRRLRTRASFATFSDQGI